MENFINILGNLFFYFILFWVGLTLFSIAVMFFDVFRTKETDKKLSSYSLRDGR